MNVWVNSPTVTVTASPSCLMVHAGIFAVPVAVEVFEGNVADPATLAAQIQKIRRRFGLQRVVLVGDRGMITEARIREDLQGVDGLDWITALRAPAIRKLLAEGSLQPSLFDEKDLAEMTSPLYPNERLVVCRNPLLADLATISRHRIEVNLPGAGSFEKITEPTSLQRRALLLLGVSL